MRKEEKLSIALKTLAVLSCLLFTRAVFAEQTEGVQIEELLKTTTSWNGNLLPAYPAGQPEITIARIQIAPGAQLPMHLHPVINAGVLTKGKLTVETADGQILHLKTGDSIAEVVNRLHRGKNEGTETAEAIVFYAGIQGQKITIKKEEIP